MKNFSKKSITKYLGPFLLLNVVVGVFTYLFNSSEKDDYDLVQIKQTICGENITHIMHCVPHYEQLFRHKTFSTGDRKWNATALSLTASYDYRTYSVVTIQADGWFGRNMYCRYFDGNRQEIYPSIQSFVFPEFAVHCCSRSGAHYLSVTTNPSDIVTEYATIIDRRKDEPKYFLSICLAPMYGYERKWLLLAELIEHYRIQGIDHFYLYIKDMDNYTFKLIKYYEKIGIAEVIRFREYNDRPGQEWQLVGTQDCLQRSRHHSRYAIFQDLDERIVPAGDVKLRNLIKETMEISGKIAMISFVGERVERTSRLPLEYKGSNTLKYHLPTFVFYQTNIMRRSPKCAIDPRRVLLMWVHHVEVYFPGYTGYELPPEKAILRHYRDLTRANLTRRLRPITHWFMYTKIGYPAKLMPLLYRQVETTLNQIYTVSNQTTNLNI